MANENAARRNDTTLDNYWMPFTANRRFKNAPRLLASAKGMYYTSVDGRQILDGAAGLWCVNAGHGRKEIADAVGHQALTLDYAGSFQMGHPLAFEFAAKLAAIAPKGLDRIFFTNSGSESVDTALKMALAYHRSVGQATRTRFIGRERGYHGVGFGGMSVGGILNNRRAFMHHLLGTDHIRHTHDPARNTFCRGLPKHGAELADDLERLVNLHGAETIAAVIVEPVAGSAGVFVPPEGYLERLQGICKRHGILLIFDEVITGFGRLGTPFAADLFGVVPDIMTTAKGLTNATIPMGAVLARREIHDAVMNAPENQIEFFHGYTYSGHPVACAAGMATLDIYEREGLLTRVASIADTWTDAMLSLKGLPNVIDVRTFGLMTGIEFTPRPNQPGERAGDVMRACYEEGVLVRFVGDNVTLSPPLIITDAEMQRIAATLSSVIKRIA